MNEKYNKALEIFKIHNKNTEESDKIIAEKIAEFSTKQDILYYIEQSNIKSWFWEVKLFHYPIIPFILALLFGKLFVYLFDYILQFTTLSFTQSLGLRLICYIPIFIFIRFLYVKYFSSNDKFRDLCFDILLENKEYNINYDKMNVVDFSNPTAIFKANQFGKSIINQRIEDIMPRTGESKLESEVLNLLSSDNVIVQQGNFLFSLFSFTWVIRCLTNPLDAFSWVLLSFLILTLPFAIYSAAGKEKRVQIKNKLRSNAIFMLLYGNLHNYYYNRKIKSVEEDIQTLKGIDADTTPFENLLLTYKFKLL